MSTNTTRTWVARPGSAWSATAATASYTLRRRAFRRPLAALWFVASGLAAWSIDARYGLGSRLFFGALYAVLLLLPFVFLGAVAASLLNWRNYRKRLFAGSVIELATSDEALFLRGPLGTEVTLPYAAVGPCRVVGDWVLFQQLGTRLISVWPRALFPEEALRRMGARSQPGRRER